MEKIRPLTLEIDEKLWNDWKETVPRTIKLTQAVEDLIRDDLNLENKNKRK